MLGNSADRRRGLGLAVGALLVSFAASACVKNVPQDGHSGKDAKAKGGGKVSLENGEGKAKGIVTYPGGDRTDWKVIELPVVGEGDKAVKTEGTLELKLQWQPPRPGLDLSFEVFDEYFHPVTAAKPKKKSKRTTKKVEPIAHAKGTYYVMVYASDRGDAGKYTLSVTFTPDPVVQQFDLSKVEVPDPPRLPTVPEAPIPCDPKKFDDKNPACANVCPDPPDMAKPACSGKCPTPPDPNIKSCADTMPCPNPPDRKIKACTKNLWPACDPAKRDPGNPNCDGFRVKLNGKVVDVQTQNSGSVITINKGSNHGVAEGWAGKVMKGGKPVPGGDFTVIRVTKTTAIGKVGLNADTVKTADAELSEP